LAVEILHLAPGAVVVAEGLVDEVEVDVVEVEPFSDAANARVALPSPTSWIQSLVATNSSLRGMPPEAMARPTASSF